MMPYTEWLLWLQGYAEAKGDVVDPRGDDWLIYYNQGLKPSEAWHKWKHI